MSEPKTILILGGSYGGISTAHYLLKHVLPTLPEKHQVILVSPSTEILSRPACPRALISDDLLPQDKLFISIPVVFAQYPAETFRFEQGTAEKLDHENRTVVIKTSDGEKTLPYHALVIATGASTASPLMSLNKDAAFLRSSWKSFRERMNTAKSIVIAGGGPTSIETAGELGEHLNGAPGWFGAQKPKVQITVVTAGAQILPLLRASVAEKAEVQLSRLGVTVVKNTKVVGVSPDAAGTEHDLVASAKVSLSDGRELEADLYIPAMGMSYNTGFLDGTLLAENGRVETNPSTLRVEKAGERVYAVGDVGNYAKPSVHGILEAVPVLCSNIRRDLQIASGVESGSVGADREFHEDTREMQLVPIGKKKGVGVVMGWQVPSFLVWAVKGRDYWLSFTGGIWTGKQWAKES